MSEPLSREQLEFTLEARASLAGQAGSRPVVLAQAEVRQAANEGRNLVPSARDDDAAAIEALALSALSYLARAEAAEAERDRLWDRLANLDEPEQHLAVAEGCIKRLVGLWEPRDFDRDGHLTGWWWHRNTLAFRDQWEPMTDAEVECMRKVME